MTTTQIQLGKSLSNVDMLGHWLQTPQNSYLGSDYGKPNASDKAEFFAKCKKDLPMLDVSNMKDLATMIESLKISENGASKNATQYSYP